MQYDVTALKKRPRSFSQLKGQDFVVATLSHSLQDFSIGHAYLFSGPRGVGKTTAARLFALALNRPSGSDVDCVEYEGASQIREGTSLDVIEIDGASYTSVDNVRSIREEIHYAPVQFTYKVYIIDEVHMLSHSAFNALLKTIEEPPSYVVFVFATTDVYKVPATVRSRCQQFSFRLIDPEQITRSLQDVCEEYQLTYAIEALQWIANEAGGSLRDAYMLFDQIRSFSQGHFSMEVIKEHLGLAGVDKINQLFVDCLAQDRSAALNHVHEVIMQGVSCEQIIRETTTYIRNVLLIKSESSAIGVLGYLSESIDPQVVERLSFEQLEKALFIFLELYRNLRYSLDQRFEVELAFSHLCNITQYVTPLQLVKRLEQLERTIPYTSHETYEQVDSIPEDLLKQSAKDSATRSTEQAPENLPENSPKTHQETYQKICQGNQQEMCP